MIAEGPDADATPLKVYWTATALEHLKVLMQETETGAPLQSQRLAQRLTQRSEVIAESPRASAVNPEFQAEEVREVIEGPFRLVFLHQPDRIDILAVLKA